MVIRLRYPLTLYDFNLNISPWSQMLLKALKIPKKTSQMFIPWLHSRDKFVSCKIDSNWEIQELPIKTPDWKFSKSSFVIRWRNKSLKISCSKLSAKTGIIFQYIFAVFLWTGTMFFPKSLEKFFPENKFQWIRQTCHKFYSF